MAEFLRFCLVGGVGFLTDASMLEIFVRLTVPTEIARVFSIAVALQVTYLLHGGFTFRHHHPRYTRRRWLHFIGCNLLGASINYVVFSAVYHYAPIADALLLRQTSLVAGTAVALGFNYLSNRHLVFAAKEKP